MKENQGMRWFPLAFLVLTAAAGADEPPVLVPPSMQRLAGGWKLVCPQKPTAVYFRRAPERLVVEWAGVRMPGAGSTFYGANVNWKQADLSHVVCEIGLNYRLQATQIKPVADGLEVSLNYSWEDRFRLTPGVVWTRCERAQDGRYLLWNELSVDTSDPAVSLEVGLAKERTDSRERPTDMISRTGALAGVNGGYFNDAGGPLGVVYRGGKLVAPHVGRRPPRTVLGVMKDRRIEMEQMVASKGQLASRSGAAWGDLELALGGGPRLLRRGRVALTTDEEELGPSGNDITRVTSRTAVATTREGKVLIVTASGYSDNHLQGLRLEELAGELLRRGASEGMNLDGGASTTMAIGDQVVSRGPGSPRLEKAVATTLLVRDSRGKAFPDRVSLDCSASEMMADGSGRVDFRISVRDASGRPVPDGTPVRLFGERLHLFQSQVETVGGNARVEGMAVASCGEARVVAECGAARGEARVGLNAGPATRLWTSLVPALGPGKFTLVVQAVDRWQNPVKGLSVSVPDAAAQLTGANGQTSFEVVRAAGSPAGSLMVTCENGLSAAVPLPPVDAPTPGPSPAPEVTP